MEERIDEFIWETLSFGRECSDEWWANQKARGRPFLDNRRKYLYSILKQEIEKSLLTDEEVETIVRRTFLLFELNEPDEEDRKETILSLLQAQLDKILKILEPMERE